eukprot:TRINITY_DN1951_c0_g1_i1.p1 TRINITY_DN1951_c0_g1~~TRINITY_DN1951_c0_g1_i1.p1  ORF type:complete len:664 (+),score=148.89 TRINITY_DN1951_c0_g1_i1:74-1993(+)
MLRVLACALLVSSAGSWYVPGVTPVTYLRGQPVRIMANSMTSNTGLFPYGAYSIKTCAPPADRRKRESKNENLGEMLWGDQIEPTLYQAEMLVNVTCHKLCNTMKAPQLKQSDIQLIEKRIENNYRGNLILDNLPISQANRVSIHQPPYSVGYALGIPSKWTSNKKARLFNHLDIVIHYHKPAGLQEGAGVDGVTEDAWRIVGFFCYPRSIAHTDPSQCNTNKEWDSVLHDHPELLIGEATEITWSYSITWKEDKETAWATRWDALLKAADSDSKIHWFSIINSLLIVLFLSGMVAIILLRSLHKDFNRYNDPENEDAAQEETGWKLCHGDVFRAPSYTPLLAILVGTGCQILGMGFVTLLFAVLGFLSPANRGGLLTAMLLLFYLLGGYAGYVGAWLSKSLKAQSWATIFGVGLLLPGVVFTTYFCLNLVHWSKNATSAIPASSLFALFMMWLGISLPLVLLGGVVGFKRTNWEPPCDVTAVPRHIPPQNWYFKGHFIIPAAGVLPFGAVFIELAFILSSLWQGRVYYVFGFLSLVFLIMIITCAEISIVVTYFQLCYEDYTWWWRSYLCTAFSGVYLMLYAIFYYFHTLNIHQSSSTVLYFGYMGLIALLFSVITGTSGFLASFGFVRTIYSYIKVA